METLIGLMLSFILFTLVYVIGDALIYLIREHWGKLLVCIVFGICVYTYIYC